MHKAGSNILNTNKENTPGPVIDCNHVVRDWVSVFHVRERTTDRSTQYETNSGSLPLEALLGVVGNGVPATAVAALLAPHPMLAAEEELLELLMATGNNAFSTHILCFVSEWRGSAGVELNTRGSPRVCLFNISTNEGVYEYLDRRGLSKSALYWTDTQARPCSKVEYRRGFAITVQS